MIRNTSLRMYAFAIVVLLSGPSVLAQDLDGCWYNTSTLQVKEDGMNFSGITPSGCTAYFEKSDVAITCGGSSANVLFEGKLKHSTPNKLDIESGKATYTALSRRQVPVGNIALQYRLIKDRLLVTIVGPDFIHDRKNLIKTANTFRRIPENKKNCLTKNFGFLDENVNHLPKPLANSENFAAAYLSGNMPLAEALLAQDADINCAVCKTNYMTPLDLAVVLQDSVNTGDRVSWLLANKADPNFESTNGYLGVAGGLSPFLRFGSSFSKWASFPSEYLVSKKAMGWLDQFLNAGADVRGISNDGSTFLHYVSNASSAPRVNIETISKGIKLAIDRGADVNAVDEFGVTPLMRLFENRTGEATYCNVDLVKAYLVNGADPRIARLDGMTAFELAVRMASGGQQQCNAVLPLLK